MSAADVSERAPDFELFDQDGKLCKLADLCARGPVVVFFYPKDETTVCTREACEFRDAYGSFGEVQAEVVGISRDSQQSHASFRDHHGLPYRLLADPGGKVAQAFGVKKTLGLLPGRTTFVIDAEQKIRLRYSAALGAKDHVDQALAKVRALSRG